VAHTLLNQEQSEKMASKPNDSKPLFLTSELQFVVCLAASLMLCYNHAELVSAHFVDVTLEAVTAASFAIVTS
jgi:hypothetical protein